MSSHIVIGSGPAGMACAHALLQRGESVQLLDAGLTLEPDRRAIVEKLKQRRPEQWTSSEVTAYQAGMNASPGGVPFKLVYGSDFAYREADEHLRVRYSNVGVRASLAAGGLSNVWGAAMMPFAGRDLGEWPFGAEKLARHYSAVIQLTGLAAEHDALENFFPLYTEHLTHLQISRQSRQLLETMERNKEALASANIHFGRSRLAVRGNKPSGEEGCIYCRLCMYGCPYGFIYSSTDTPRLSNFEHRY